MPSDTRTTIDHDEIRNWVEQHDGLPASVHGTASGDEAAGVLRIDFPGGATEDVLDHIGWNDWFATFEDRELAFLYQAQKAGGQDSTFFKLVDRSDSAG